MSVVVAFKYKDGIIVGADRRVSSERLRDDVMTKISMTAYTGHVKGVVGDVRIGNLIAVKDELMDYEDILKGEEATIEYTIGTIVPNLIDFLTDSKAIAGTPEFPAMMTSEVMYVTGDHIFVIAEDFAVLEYPTWAAIGCGEEMVSGLLSNFSTETLAAMPEADAIDMMINCISYACRRDSAVSSELDYILVKAPVYEEETDDECDKICHTSCRCKDSE